MSSVEEGGEVQITRLKWFATGKGFGFVHVEEQNTDAFLHFSTLKQAGYDDLPPGTTIHCTIGNGPKGQQVVEIKSVDQSTAEPESRPRHAEDEDEGDLLSPVDGELKFYDNGKGFGFVVVPSLGRDVFLPGKLCDSSWDMVPGLKLKVTYREGERGLVAASVKLSS